MHVLVTGAGGHLGSNLVRELLAQGHAVTAMVRREKPSLAGVEVPLEFGDIMDAEPLLSIIEGHDVVVHLAGRISIVGDPDGAVRAVNVQGTENVARACLAAGARLVHCSSIHAFDLRSHGETLMDESGPRVPAGSTRHTAYDLSKADGGRVVRALLPDGLDAVIVHPTGVIGPQDYDPSRMGQVFLDLHRGSLPSLVQGGFDFVDIRDVVCGLVACAERGRTGESYLMSGRYVTIPELALIAEAITGRRPPLFTSPMWLARIAAPFFQGYAQVRGTEPLYTGESLATLRQRCSIDSSKAARDLGFVSRDLEESVRDLYTWFDAQGVLR